MKRYGWVMSGVLCSAIFLGYLCAKWGLLHINSSGLWGNIIGFAALAIAGRCFWKAFSLPDEEGSYNEASYKSKRPR